MYEKTYLKLHFNKYEVTCVMGLLKAINRIINKTPTKDRKKPQRGDKVGECMRLSADSQSEDFS